MDLTIITPNLNYARYLDDCLKSVASQDGFELEHLIMDGGSDDGSESIVSKYPHASWFSGPDNGMSQAINRGFERAKGDWVMWLNADDRLTNGALNKIYTLLKSATEDIVYTDFNFIDDQGGYLRRVKLPKWSPFVHIHHHCYIGSTAAFYRKETTIDEGFRLREDFHYVMDGEFYIRLHDQGKTFRHIAEVIADFRLHGSNASMRHLGKSRGMDQILASERQHIESRAIRRCYGYTPFKDPYLNGLSDGFLWLIAKAWKGILKLGR